MTQSPSFRRKPLSIVRKSKNVTLNLSSSSDELPELNTAQINDQDSIQFESESEYESYSYEAEEINWKSNKSANHKVHPPITKTGNSVRRPTAIQRGQNSINQRGRRPTPKQKPQTKNQNEPKSQNHNSDINQKQSKSSQIQQNQEERLKESKQDQDT